MRCIERERERERETERRREGERDALGDCSARHTSKTLLYIRI